MKCSTFATLLSKPKCHFPFTTTLQLHKSMQCFLRQLRCRKHITAAEIAAGSDGRLRLEAGDFRRDGGQTGPPTLVHSLPGGGADGAHVRPKALTGAHVFVRVVVHPVHSVLLPANVVEAGRPLHVIRARRGLHSQHTHTHRHNGHFPR